MAMKRIGFWWQHGVIGGDASYRELLDRADAAKEYVEYLELVAAIIGSETEYESEFTDWRDDEFGGVMAKLTIDAMIADELVKQELAFELDEDVCEEIDPSE